MTVAELIDRLTRMPQEADVLIEYDSMLEPISVLRGHAPCVILFHEGYGSQAEHDDYSQSIARYLEKKGS